VEAALVGRFPKGDGFDSHALAGRIQLEANEGAAVGTRCPAGAGNKPPVAVDLVIDVHSDDFPASTSGSNKLCAPLFKFHHVIAQIDANRMG